MSLFIVFNWFWRLRFSSKIEPNPKLMDQKKKLTQSWWIKKKDSPKTDGSKKEPNPKLMDQKKDSPKTDGSKKEPNPKLWIKKRLTQNWTRCRWILLRHTTADIPFPFPHCNFWSHWVLLNGVSMIELGNNLKKTYNTLVILILYTWASIQISR